MKIIFPNVEQAERPVPMETIQLHLYEWAILQTAEKILDIVTVESRLRD